MTVSQTDTTKTTVSLSNFKNPINTPLLAQTIGDWCLRIGVIGLAIVGLPAVLPAVALSAIPTATLATISTIGGIGVAIGTLGKTITKLFGTTLTEQGN